jgi:hypothetical protein
MTTSRRVLAVAAAFAFLAPREVAAMGAVVGSSEQPASIASAREAVATSTGRTVRWGQIAVTHDTSAFAWLVPVLPGSMVDLASDAWLDALDAATVPVVQAPPYAPGCLVSLEPQVLPPAATPSSRVPWESLVVLDDPALTSFLGGAGFAVSDGLAAGLDAVFTAGGAVLVLVYDAGAEPIHALRIVDDGPPTLPLSLTGILAKDIPVTAFAIADGAIQAGSSPLTIDPGALVWSEDGTTNYLADVASTLAAVRDTGWLTQSSEPDAFFQGTRIDPDLALPSVVDDYYRLASAYGDTSVDPDVCATAARATLGSTASYGAACPLGAVAVVPGPTRCAPPDAYATPITGLVCGAAVDVALAVGNLAPASVWITRVTGIVTAATAADVPVVGAGTTVQPILLTAGSYGTDCGSVGAGATEAGVPGAEGGLDDSEDAGAGPFTLFDDAGINASATADPTASTSDGCDSSSSSSSTTDDSGGGCGGDTSSDDDGGCGGDSSGDTSGGCSGDDPDIGDCSAGRHGGRGRSPVSRVILVGVAFLGLSRRLRRRGSGAPR